jgi:small subunit ribosomal protein S7
MRGNIKQFIPEHSSQLEEKFINYLMQGGKKSTARKILKDTFTEITRRGEKDPSKLFERAIENIKPSKEVKAKRIGGAVYQIPMEVKNSRQVLLASQWILKAAHSKKGAPMFKKLANELLDAANGQGSAFKKKEDTHKMAQANKAFAHFARY